MPQLPDWPAALKVMGIKYPLIPTRRVQILTLLRKHFGQNVTFEMMNRELGHRTTNNYACLIIDIRNKFIGTRLWIESREKGYAMVFRQIEKGPTAR